MYMTYYNGRLFGCSTKFRSYFYQLNMNKSCRATDAYLPKLTNKVDKILDHFL